jgi:hypothetical protein
MRSGYSKDILLLLLIVQLAHAQRSCPSLVRPSFLQGAFSYSTNVDTPRRLSPSSTLTYDIGIRFVGASRLIFFKQRGFFDLPMIQTGILSIPVALLVKAMVISVLALLPTTSCLSYKRTTRRHLPE